VLLGNDERISAHTALRMGIVTRIHPTEGWLRHFVAAGLCLLLSGLVRLAE